RQDLRVQNHVCFLIQYYIVQYGAGGAGQSFVRAFESCCHRFVGRHHIKTPPKAELSTAYFSLLKFNKRLSCSPVREA
ncbi:MAG: hypothetical protein LBM77_09320, partial [Spirochaetaceae bacterium]|nr:hypothetical protein [Spirochaetaceae bacterium]